MINRNSPMPIYCQLAEEIKEQIKSGKLKPGDTITEVGFQNLYNISRVTVHKSISVLINEGYLKRIKGKYTYVSVDHAEKPKFMSTLKGFAQEMNEKEIPYSTKVLIKQVIDSSIEISEKLEIDKESKVFHLERLRLIEEKPVLISNSYIPMQFCPNIENIDFEKNSLYKTLETDYGLTLIYGQRIFSAISPRSTKEANYLDVKLKTPILYVKGIVYTKNHIPVEYHENLMTGSFAVDLFLNKKNNQ